MRQFVLLPFLILALSITLTAQERNLPDEALCTVCALRGETEPEKVKAHTDYEGKTYYFCSKNCQKEFEAEPLAYLPPQLPRAAPAFVVETLDGRDVSLNDFENKIVLLDFWASWCKPCFEMMPKLQELYDAYSDKDFVVLGISIDEGDDRVKKTKKVVDKLQIVAQWTGKIDHEEVAKVVTDIVMPNSIEKQ
jgi:thiol-disulfide isomerase/thioredoxin